MRKVPARKTGPFSYVVDVFDVSDTLYCCRIERCDWMSRVTICESFGPTREDAYLKARDEVRLWRDHGVRLDRPCYPYALNIL